MVVLVDYQMGNLRSILYKLQKIGVESIVSSKAEDIEKADRLILPGVGAFDTGMRNLEANDLITILNKKVLEEKTPILGICVGMQLYAHKSEEGSARGLGWIDAQVKRFNFAENKHNLKIPLVGWNTINVKKESPVLKGITPDQKFYFTHSYHVCCRSPEDIVATSCYGYDFVSVLQHENIFGFQFHAEKSHHRGIDLVKNFVECT